MRKALFVKTITLYARTLGKKISNGCAVADKQKRYEEKPIWCGFLAHIPHLSMSH